jgi:hypothetical protein
MNFLRNLLVKSFHRYATVEGKGHKLLNWTDSHMYRNDWYQSQRKDARHDREGHVA